MAVPYYSEGNTDRNPPSQHPIGPPQAIRGGSWSNLPRRCRSALRTRARPDNANYIIGFRVICLPSPGEVPPRRAVLRGGSWYSSPKSCRSAHRFRSQPDYASLIVGFRVVCIQEVD